MTPNSVPGRERAVIGALRRPARSRFEVDESLEELEGLEPEDDEEKADFLPAAENLGETDAE